MRRFRGLKKIKYLLCQPRLEGILGSKRNFLSKISSSTRSMILELGLGQGFLVEYWRSVVMCGGGGGGARSLFD